MKTTLARRLVQACLLATSIATSHAQITYDYTGMGSTFYWPNTASWEVAGFPAFPNEPDALVRFGALQNQDADRVNLRLGYTALNPPERLIVGAMVFLPTLDCLMPTFLVRNSSTTVTGTLEMHGMMMDVDGTPANVLISNLGTTQQVLFSLANASYVIELHSSGVIHTAADTNTQISVSMVDGGGVPRNITKTGPGILRFGTQSQNNTYSGGFTLAGGIVEWSNSGSVNSTPFGIGPLTLRGGALRSTTSSARTVYAAITLDGAGTLGSPDPDFNGILYISNGSGTLATTLAAETVLTVHNSTPWRQNITGNHRLIKDGPGELLLEGSNDFSALTVRGGTVAMGSATSGNAPTEPPSSMADHFLLDGGALRFIGNWSDAPLGERRGMALGAAGGTIEVTGANVVVANGPVTGAGALTKAGTGVLQLAQGAHTGPTLVDQGWLFISGALPSSPVTVETGAALGGSGTLGAAVLVREGGTLAPGGRAAPGSLTTQAPVQLEAGATLGLRASGMAPGVDHDVLVVHGSLSLGGAELGLQLGVGYQPDAGQAFVLVDNRAGPAAITGRLSRDGVVLEEGSSFTIATPAFSQDFTITYNHAEAGFQNSIAVVAGEPVPVGPTLTSTWTAAADFTWRNADNWTTEAAPDAANVIAVFDGTSNVMSHPNEGQTRIGFTMEGGTPADPGELTVAGVVLGATNTPTRRIEMSTLDAFGYFNVHGFTDIVNDQYVNMLLRNDSAGNPDDYPTMLLRPITSTRVFEVRFVNSGVIHVENPDARVWFLVPVTEAANPVTITKTGQGILHFGANYPSFGMNTTTGGLILEEGSLRTNRNSIIVDGAMTESPFGLGPVTLRGGALQSSTTVARTFDNDFIIDGDVMIGSTANADYNATITIRGDAGTTTTLLRDSTLTVHNTTNWNQPIAGDFRLTQAGGGTLVLGGPDNSFAALSVLDGVVSIAGSLSGTAPANPPAEDGTMEDHILLNGGTLQFSGSWNATPWGSRRGIALGPNGGTIEVTGSNVVQVGAPMTNAGESPGAFTKTGTGIYLLRSLSSAEGLYSGPTRVEQGAFIMNNILPFSPVEVFSGARLGGLGEFGAPVTVRSGASLTPGGRLERGIMTTTDSLQVEAGATLAYRIDGTVAGTEYDQLVISRALSLAGVNLEIVLGFQPAQHDTFVLIENQSPVAVSGPLVFNGVPLGEGAEFLVETGEFSQAFTITYGYSAGGLENSVAIFAGSPPAPGAGDYATWRAERFGNTTDPAGAPLAQPSGQPVANLMLHALGADLTAESADSLPRAVEAGVLTFTRRTPLGTRLVVEGTSGNPSGAWQQLTVLEPGASFWDGPAPVVETPAGAGRVRVSVTDPAPDTTGVRLLRVRAELP